MESNKEKKPSNKEKKPSNKEKKPWTNLQNSYKILGKRLRAIAKSDNKMGSNREK